MFEYYCLRCRIKVETDETGFVECPQCGKGDEIRDYGDYEEPIWAHFRDDYNWNKP